MKNGCITCLALILTVVLFSCKGKNEAPVAALMEVPVVKVMQQNIALESEYTGQTYGESDVEIRARVEGLITGISFREGSMVKKGQLLYTIDDLPYKNNVDRARAALAEAQTAKIKAENDLGRIEPLAKIGAVSQRELVAAQASFSSAKAMVESSEAALRNSIIELDYCSLTAPLSGIIGISKFKIGDFVSRGPGMVLNTISSVENIRVRFTISEKEYLRIARLLIELNSKIGQNKDNVKMILADGTMYPTMGTLNFGDREVDPSTGAMTFEASFKNEGSLIRPGQYVKLRIITEFRRDALLIPQRAVNEMQGMFQVFTVADSNKLVMRIVKVGPAYRMSYVIEGGLKKDDRIVVGGTMMLRNGSIIKPDEKSWSPDSTNISSITN